jgi:hypothetical protein
MYLKVITHLNKSISRHHRVEQAFMPAFQSQTAPALATAGNRFYPHHPLEHPEFHRRQCRPPHWHPPIFRT